MAPDDLEKFLGNVDRGRRDFLRKVIAGAVFAPPLMASFSLDGPSVTAAQANSVSNQCANQTPVCDFFDFSGTEYQDNFKGILRPTDINPGVDLATNTYPSLNFTGSANNSGSTWLTVLNGESLLDCTISLSVDILIRKFNNSKGAGVLALFNEGTGKKGLVLLVIDAGNTDLLQLSTVDQTGKLVTLKTVALGAGIAENVWYRLAMNLSSSGSTISVTGTVSQHMVPTNPNSPVTTQVGGTLMFSGPLPAGIEPSGQAGLVARAVNAIVDSSLTNFTVCGVPGEAPC